MDETIQTGDKESAASPSAQATIAAPPADNKTPSSTKEEAQRPSLADIANKVLAEKAAKPGTEEEASKDEGSGRTSDETEEAQASEQTEEKEETPAAEEKSEEKGPVPYTRFEEVNKAKNDLENRVREMEPIVQAQNSIVEYCTKNEIDAQSFREAMELTALVRHDPVAARKKLLELANMLGDFDPDALPQDLQARVAEGEMSEKAAKELWAARVQSKQFEGRQRGAERTQAVREAQAITSAVAAWDASKRASDLAYKPAADGKVGLRELVERNFAYLVQTKQPNDAAEIVQLLEAAYADAKQIIKPAVAAPTKPQLSSSRSSGNAPKEPKNGAEVAQAVLAKHGISWRPRG